MGLSIKFIHYLLKLMLDKLYKFLCIPITRNTTMAIVTVAGKAAKYFTKEKEHTRLNL